MIMKYVDRYLNLYAGQDQQFRVAALNAVMEERAAQADKWGMQNHGPAMWNLILTEEVGEFAQATLEARLCDIDDESKLKQEYLNEMIQVAAVALSAVESFMKDLKGVQ